MQLSLNERIAKALGWTVGEVTTFSRQALRELLTLHPFLQYDLTEEIQSGNYIRSPKGN